ncbi:DNA-packaging protein [Sphingomonas sp. G-3-2-10]|nr:DNA-packaging protein [Sphingomonas sp. G-3-2-10]
MDRGMLRLSAYRAFQIGDVFSKAGNDAVIPPVHRFPDCEAGNEHRHKEGHPDRLDGVQLREEPVEQIHARDICADAWVCKLHIRLVEAMIAEYGGTRLGRQELDGEMIDDVAGALWTRETIEACRVAAPPELVRVVIGVDPPVSADGDACGIVAVGLGRDERGYVIEDASVRGMTPEGWARAVAACAARHGADRVVAEKNQGGDMVASTLRAADAGLPVKLVSATRGKSVRAEPVSLLYEAGRVKHVGAWSELEDELCGLVMGGGYEGPGRSPDRADALVWALSALMVGKKTRAAVRAL